MKGRARPPYFSALAAVALAVTVATSAPATPLITRREFLRQVLQRGCHTALTHFSDSWLGLLLGLQSAPIPASPADRAELIRIVTGLRESFGPERGGYVEMMRQAVRLHRERGVPVLEILHGFEGSVAAMLALNGAPSIATLSPGALARFREMLQGRLPNILDVLDVDPGPAPRRPPAETLPEAPPPAADPVTMPPAADPVSIAPAAEPPPPVTSPDAPQIP